MKEVIRDQSRFCYEKDNFWKDNEKLRNGKVSGSKSPEKTKYASKYDKRTSFDNENKSSSELKSTLKYSLSENENPSFSNISRSNVPKGNITS